MREDLPKRNVVPIGSHGWLERQRTSQEPHWHEVLPKPAETMVTDKQPSPEIMPQFWREIGRRGGRQRSRNYARSNFRKAVRFWRRYGSHPNDVKAAPVYANDRQRCHLRTLASRGGQARARKYSPEQLKSWAAMGGRAKVARRQNVTRRAEPPIKRHCIGSGGTFRHSIP